MIFILFKTLTDLVILDIEKFDVILGMRWLYPSHVVLDYHAKTITIVIPGKGN